MNALYSKLKGLLYALIYTITFVSGQLFADFILMIPYAIAQYSSFDQNKIKDFAPHLIELFKTDFIPRYSWLISIFSALSAVFFLFIITKFTSRSFKEEAAIRKCPLDQFKYVLTLAIGLQILITLLIDALNKLPFFQELIQQQNDYSASLTSNPAKIPELLAVAIFAPLCEEIFFRGAVISSLKENSFKNFSAIIIQALMFAIVHGVPVSMFYAFLIGIIMGCLRIRSNSIWPGFCLHSVFNCVAYWTYMLGKEPHIISYVLLWILSVTISLTSFILLSGKKKTNEY